MSNVNQAWDDMLSALGDSTGANNINEFREKFVTALTSLVASVPADADIEAAIAAKTEVAALTGGSTAADIVSALQA